MSKIFTYTAIIVTIALLICGVNKMLNAPDCYYTNYNTVVCDK